MLVPMPRATAAGSSLEQHAPAQQNHAAWDLAVTNGSRQTPMREAATDGKEDGPQRNKHHRTSICWGKRTSFVGYVICVQLIFTVFCVYQVFKKWMCYVLCVLCVIMYLIHMSSKNCISVREYRSNMKFVREWCIVCSYFSTRPPLREIHWVGSPAFEYPQLKGTNIWICKCNVAMQQMAMNHKQYSWSASVY